MKITKHHTTTTTSVRTAQIVSLQSLRSHARTHTYIAPVSYYVLDHLHKSRDSGPSRVRAGPGETFSREKNFWNLLFKMAHFWCTLNFSATAGPRNVAGPGVTYPPIPPPLDGPHVTTTRNDSFSTLQHRCDKRLQRLPKNLCKRVYYFVNVYLNKNHMSETKQNYDGKPSYSALRSITDRVHWVTVLVTVNSCLMMEHSYRADV